ncbi:hypothetical protein MRX96_032975 [Rhipicephalus microplus]
MALSWPNERGTLAPSRLLTSKPGNITVYRVAVAEKCACPAGSGGDAQHQVGFVVQPPGEGLPQLVNATVPQPSTISLPRPPNAVPLQPSSAKPRYRAVSKVSYREMVFEYVKEKLEEELYDRLVSLYQPNSTEEDNLKDYKRICQIREILENVMPRMDSLDHCGQSSWSAIHR